MMVQLDEIVTTLCLLVRIMINLPGNVTTRRSFRDFSLGNPILTNPVERERR